MKKKRLMMALLSAVVLVAAGGTYAAFVASSDPVEKRVSASELGIAIEQDPWVAGSGSVWTEGESVLFQGGVPGTKAEGGVRVKNVRAQDVYVRVSVYRSWLEGQEKVTDGSLDVREIEYGWNDVDTANKWILVDDKEDPEVSYYYYKEPLEPGQETANLMDYFTVLARSLGTNQNAYADKGVKIALDADGIQAVGAESAMLAEWGVEVEMDENGYLTRVSEQ